MSEPEQKNPTAEKVEVTRERIPFTIIENPIISDVKRVSGVMLNVYQALCYHADVNGECRPSYATIATTARCARSTAIVHIKNLCDLGYVEKISRLSPAGDPTSNGYRVRCLTAAKEGVVRQEDHPPKEVVRQPDQVVRQEDHGGPATGPQVVRLPDPELNKNSELNPENKRGEVCAPTRERAGARAPAPPGPEGDPEALLSRVYKKYTHAEMIWTTWDREKLCMLIAKEPLGTIIAAYEECQKIRVGCSFRFFFEDFGRWRYRVRDRAPTQPKAEKRRCPRCEGELKEWEEGDFTCSDCREKGLDFWWRLSGGGLVPLEEGPAAVRAPPVLVG